ncbi:DUF6285 domain-containing protein [Pseudomonas plecoglossicida]|uniref:DUF6285 domain-containing protein n=1 Tax=Pseudomonas plecoglossicida TaxID=70775 RepID=A0AAD0VS15_PSEDL|nr:DUF6285 domain-containing protein [Pseudomonas plecoglossicida]AXM94497.1 hypothetical protein DVB73_00955 [Pseudomonas plecoglossicida]EPB93923.1 hypothetical protein L321_21462 [Pseudomonas plecoglossicida NB2011]QLB55231.1 hypothetical protein HAV28_10480 [Pseudomonas plecoglossicida]GLR35129.1 hypothetical protein GCM10011247_05260 [Pseudomonas plecoglossicida]
MNQPDAQDLLATARDTLLKHLLPALPAPLHYEARMVASAMLIASRELAQAQACADIERQAMADLLALQDSNALTPEQSRALLARQIRQGAYDQAGEARARLLSALRAINRAQLSISNPKVLAHD